MIHINELADDPRLITIGESAPVMVGDNAMLFTHYRNAMMCHWCSRRRRVQVRFVVSPATRRTADYAYRCSRICAKCLPLALDAVRQGRPMFNLDSEVRLGIQRFLQPHI